MKILVLGVTALIILIGCSTKEKTATTNDSLTETEVKDFISAYDGIWASRDTNAMKKVMSETYIYFTSSGSTTDRTRIISWFTPADKYKVDTAARTEISVYLNGNTAIVSSRWIGNGTFGEEKFNDDQRCSLVVQKINGELKITGEHCTQIEK